MDLEIESLLFKQVQKPKNHFMTKIINLWENRYRVNIYVEIEENGLIKRKISSSYFCHYKPGNLTIMLDSEKTEDLNESRTTR